MCFVCIFISLYRKWNLHRSFFYYPTKPVVLILTIFHLPLRQPCFVSDTQPLPSHFHTRVPSPCFIWIHTCTPVTHTRTHIITTTTITMQGKQRPWTCLAPPPPTTSPHLEPPTPNTLLHFSSCLCMQAFPWQLWCGGVCLATLLLHLIWLMVWVEWWWWGGGSSLITDKRSHKYVAVLLGRKREKRDLKDGSLQLHRSAER